MKRKDFQQLSALRLKEARVLLQNHCWEGAYYLAGYAAECALKACIAKGTERHDFPEKKRVNASYTHDLEELLVLAGLKPALDRAVDAHPEVNAGWKLVRSWKEDSRYNRPSREDAEDLVRALGDRNGMLRWSRLHW
jgi:hypothetical protein